MRPHTLRGFADELLKISEVSLAGLSPEKALAQQPAPPLETPGMSKALAVLDRRDMAKTASRRKEPTPTVVVMGGGGKSVDAPDSKVGDKLRSAGAHAIGGMAAGRLLSDFHTKTMDPKKKFIGMAAGGAAGLADYALKKHRQKTEKKIPKAATIIKTSSLLSPGLQLNATKQVGTIRQTLKRGPSLKNQVPLIGRKGSLPTTPGVMR